MYISTKEAAKEDIELVNLFQRKISAHMNIDHPTNLHSSPSWKKMHL